MTLTKSLSIFALCLLCSIVGYSQEICDNGIDDDQDGLIDLNDDDCVCESFSPSSLIPNPSFEDMTCCPNSEADLNCAVTWIQASTPTTDYLHTCGITEMPFLGYQMPLPVPDGEGAIGFRDGKPGVPNFKEYAGACLTEPMTPGVSYMLDFFIGFHDEPGSMTFDMAVFATTSCGNLPFGGGDQNFGCPTNGPGWVELGAMTFSGENEWVDVEFEFMADQAYEAIVLGPACAINPNVNQDPYFFFDDLVLAESSEFGVPLMSIEGNICEEDIILTTSDTIMGTYQWYKDGIALIGETGQSLVVSSVPEPQGVYEVVVTTSLGCFNGEQITVTIPEYASAFDATICEDEVYEFGEEVYTSPGTYEGTFTAADGCDSIVTLTLSVLPVFSVDVVGEFCFGDNYELNGESYNLGGIYTQTLTAENGCDSLITLTLIENSASEALLFESTCTGSAIEVNGEVYTETGYYEQLLVNTVGCDSFLFVDVQILNVTEETLEASFCGTSTYELNGEVYGESGTYVQTLLGQNGCDSILTLELSLLPVFEEQIAFDICDGDSVEVGNEVYDTSGTYVQELVSSLGCDSTVIVDVVVLPINVLELEEVVCDNDSLVLNETIYNETGEYSQVLAGTNGCDSLIQLNLTVLETFQTDYESILCINDQITFYGQEITEPGIYINNLVAFNGCDSLIVLNVGLDTTCNNCVSADSRGDFGLSFNIALREQGNYDVLVKYREEQVRFDAVSLDKVRSLATIFVLEKERLYQGHDSKDIILMNEARYGTHADILMKEKRPTITASQIKAYVDISDKQVEGLDEAKINGYFGLIMQGVEQGRVGSKFSFN